MKIVQPHKVSAEIMDLIYEAKEYLILVSPYIDFTHWKRLESELINASKRGVRIDFFVRNEVNNKKSWHQIENIGFKPKLVENLHAKIYFNESCGIVSSMNLLAYSQSNSIEIGCKTETKEELDELKKVVKDVIKPQAINEAPDEFDIVLAKHNFTIILQEYLQESLSYRVTVKPENGILSINAFSNLFALSTEKESNNVVVAGVLSGKEAASFKAKSRKFFQSDYFDYSIEKGNKNNYDIVQAVSKKRLSHHNMEHLKPAEKRKLLEELTWFIEDTRNFKKACY